MTVFSYLEQIRFELNVRPLRNHDVIDHADMLFKDVIKALAVTPSRISRQELEEIVEELGSRELTLFNFELARTIERSQPEMLQAFQPWVLRYADEMLAPKENPESNFAEDSAYSHPLFILFGYCAKIPVLRDALKHALDKAVPRLVQQGRIKSLVKVLEATQRYSYTSGTEEISLATLVPVSEVLRAFDMLEAQAASESGHWTPIFNLAKLAFVISDVPELRNQVATPDRIAKLMGTLVVAAKEVGSGLACFSHTPNAYMLDLVAAYHKKPGYLEVFTVEHMTHYINVVVGNLDSSDQRYYGSRLLWFIDYSRHRSDVYPVIKDMLPQAIDNILSHTPFDEERKVQSKELVDAIVEAVRDDAGLHGAIAHKVTNVDEVLTAQMQEREARVAERRVKRGQPPQPV